MSRQTQRRIHAGLAHLVERHLAKVEVASSSLVTRSMRGSLAQLGEHLPYKQRVTGSSPVTSTIFWFRSQAVRQRSAKPLCGGSNPPGTSKLKRI